MSIASIPEAVIAGQHAASDPAISAWVPTELAGTL